jgi:hypothetical protein
VVIIAGVRCPVWRMMACASAPASTAAVTNPARSECPPSRVGSYPAAAARRCTIAVTAGPDSRPGRIRPVLCRVRNAGSPLPPSASAAAERQRWVLGSSASTARITAIRPPAAAAVTTARQRAQTHGPQVATSSP